MQVTRQPDEARLVGAYGKQRSSLIDLHHRHLKRSAGTDSSPLFNRWMRYGRWTRLESVEGRCSYVASKLDITASLIVDRHLVYAIAPQRLGPQLVDSIHHHPVIFEHIIDLQPRIRCVK